MVARTLYFFSFLLGMPGLHYAQLTDTENYLIYNDSIKNIKEWRIDYDSTGRPKDTILEYEFLFNKEHQLVELRCDFTDDHKKFISYKYEYPDPGVKIQKYDNPYILMGGYFRGYPDSKCETYNRNGDPVSTVLVYNGKTESWSFKYDAGLLIEKIIVFDGILQTRYLIEYSKWK